jgi:hypothetical protein
MIVRVEPRGAAADVDPPSGQRASRLPHVVLGVVADAEGEQLHELAGQVLVRLADPVPAAVQPDQHRGIDDHRVGEGAEVAAAEPAQRLVLRGHQLRVAHLPRAGGEVAVPEPGHPFRERLVHGGHPVQPPHAEPA